MPSTPQEFGHVDVPAHWPTNPGLAAWVGSQRRRWRGRQGAPLTPSQLGRLEACGFSFEAQQGAWERRYAELRDLARQRGGSLGGAPLPAGTLRAWAGAQLQQWRLGKLAPERCVPGYAAGRVLGCLLGCACAGWQHAGLSIPSRGDAVLRMCAEPSCYGLWA